MGSNQSHHLELVSFELCPYVQRSVITLLHKKVDHKITFIDLESPPAWFHKFSPLGKVPILLVRESENTEPTVLFESAVINEYVDEISPPLLMPSDPLKKGFERAWIAISGELFMAAYPIMTSQDKAEIAEAKKEVFELLGKVEDVITDGPFFTGREFSLLDSSFAPFFMRIDLFKSMREAPEWKTLPKVRRWADTLSRLESVKKSVKPDFVQKFSTYLKAREGLLASEIQV